MIGQVTVIYCITDDALKAVGHKDDPRADMTDAEVITTAITAAQFFGGNLENARDFLKDTGCIPTMLSKSQLNRRLHGLNDTVMDLFHQFGSVFKQSHDSNIYLVDSFPVAVCDNIRIGRCRLVHGEQYRGYIASKRRYFYGLRVHVVTTDRGLPVEMALVPGATHDVNGLEALPLDFPPSSEVYFDSAYTDYEIEDVLVQQERVELCVMRKKNSHRWDEPPVRWYKKMTRHYIETVLSQITRLFPKFIHAVTETGFQLKLLFFVFAFMLDKAFLSSN